MRQLDKTDLDLTRYAAIVFDFDGTLAPCLDLRAMKREVLEFTLRESGIARETIESMMMVEFIEHTHQWLKRQGKTHDYFERAHALIKNIELDAAANTRLFSGTDTMLAHLRDKGFALGIVTRNCKDAVHTMYPQVREICASVITRDEAHYLKPDPRHLQQCLDELEASPSRCLMIGDGVIDVQIAKALGAASLAVTSGHNSQMELTEAEPDWLLPHVNELERFL